jgi:hypothetical protein
MIRRLAGLLVLSVLLISGLSCAKLGEPGAGEQKLVLEKLSQPDTIPAKWGKVVSVSSVAGQADWAQIWLLDDEGTIRIVPYNVSANYLSSQARVIRRD